MSDECLMKQETVFSFYVDCQAVMRKFTLATKAVFLIVIVIICEVFFKVCYQTWIIDTILCVIPCHFVRQLMALFMSIDGTFRMKVAWNDAQSDME